MLKKILRSTLLLCVCLCAIRCSGTGLMWVVGPSMYPTFVEGRTLLFVTYLDGDIERGDIAIIQLPTIRLCKRIIGIPGDTIVMAGCRIEVNGEDATDIYNAVRCDFGPRKEIKLENGQFWALGDNRMNSMDSRTIGIINIEQIIGTFGPYFELYWENSK